MRESIKKGLGFGLTSGIITTLGLIIGLYESVGEEVAIIGGILIIAFADAMSDSLGMHISEEAVSKNNEKHVWEATFSTFFFKLVFAASFVIPFLIFSLETSILVSVIWGVVLISGFSLYIAKTRKTSAYSTIVEHLLIMLVVIAAAFLIGKGINSIFN